MSGITCTRRSMTLTSLHVNWHFSSSILHVSVLTTDTSNRETSFKECGP